MILSSTFLSIFPLYTTSFNCNFITKIILTELFDKPRGHISITSKKHLGKGIAFKWRALLKSKKKKKKGGKQKIKNIFKVLRN